MKVKISDIVNSRPILEEMNNTRLSIPTAYKVHKLVEESNIVLQAFEKERHELLEVHAKKSKDGKQYVFAKTGKAKEKFAASIKEILEAEVDFPDISVSETELESFSIMPGSVSSISWFLK